MRCKRRVPGVHIARGHEPDPGAAHSQRERSDSGPASAATAAIKEHAFFAKYIDWERLLSRSVRPPFQPRQEAFANFDQQFTSMASGCDRQDDAVPATDPDGLPALRQLQLGTVAVDADVGVTDGCCDLSVG
ncbi:hypothetical protein PINS_up021998 [Pythium insidiosum]|nr:hypothetical protein PINS_up021998 [Pythium insidiosum]